MFQEYRKHITRRILSVLTRPQDGALACEVVTASFAFPVRAVGEISKPAILAASVD